MKMEREELAVAVAILVKLDRIVERLEHVANASPLDELIDSNTWLLQRVSDTLFLQEVSK